MNYKKLLSRVVVFAIMVVTVACNLYAKSEYTALPQELDGSMMTFDYSKCSMAPLVPDTLQPVYATYVARHGARYLSSIQKMKPIIDALEDGRQNRTLTQEGRDFLAYIEMIRQHNEGHWGDLSEIGRQEEEFLSNRLLELFQPLGLNASKVKTISSYVPRCVMTMYFFNGGLVHHNDGLQVGTEEGHQYDSLVCCFMADSQFAAFRKNGDWKAVYDEFVDRTVPAEPARRLFTTTNLSNHKLRKLSLDIYEVLKANRASGLEPPTTRWMSLEEYTACWRASNLQHYLRNTISPISTLAVNATVPLLKQIINDIDEAVSSDNPERVLNGYFGHAETLLPLLSLMKIPGCFDLPLKYEDLENNWKIQEITPLGANLLIVISKGPSGRHYASIQLNGQPVQAITGETGPIEWRELKDYWNNLMKAYSTP